MIQLLQPASPYLLPYMGYTGMYRSTGYGFCLSESGTESTNQRFCLEQGLLFAIPTETLAGLLFCCQNRAANERCCCSRSCPAAFLLKHAVSDSKVNRISHFSVWNRISFSLFCLEQGSKIVSLCLFSRLEQGQVPGHSVAHLTWGEHSPPPGYSTISHIFRMLHLYLDPWTK